MPKLHSITYTPHGAPRKSQDAFVRLAANGAQLIQGYGIDGDRKGGSPKRQINIMSLSTLEALSGDGLKVAPGQMGEQLIIDGFDVGDLKAGDRVQIGASAIIEVTEFRSGCDRFQQIQGHDPAQLKGRLGIMARVVTSGTITIGDAVRVIYDTKPVDE
jgi:MOSC domain-containing protein YiiM